MCSPYLPEKNSTLIVDQPYYLKSGFPPLKDVFTQVSAFLFFFKELFLNTNTLSIIPNYLPSKECVVFHFNQLESTSLYDACAKFAWNWPSGSRAKRWQTDGQKKDGHQTKSDQKSESESYLSFQHRWVKMISYTFNINRWNYQMWSIFLKKNYGLKTILLQCSLNIIPWNTVHILSWYNVRVYHFEFLSTPCSLTFLNL